MSSHIICDGCGQVIDESISYYTASISTVQMIDGVLTSGGAPLQRDYHTEHLPENIDLSGADSP